MARGKDVIIVVRYASLFLLNSVAMSAVILAVLTVNSIFFKVTTAKLRYKVWMVILIGLIIPFRPVIGTGIFTIPFSADVLTPVSSIEGILEGVQIDYEPAQTVTGQDVPGTENPVKEGILSPVFMCIIIWCAAAIMVFAYHIWRYIRFIKLIRRWCTPVEDEATHAVLQSVLKESRLKKKPALKSSSFVSSSMLTGFIRPVILLPEKRFDYDELELIFKHELIHYKRRDLLVKLLNVIALSLHWFNPFVYCMCSAMQTDGEASCDEAVLENVNADGRKVYAEVIIGMIGKNTSGTFFSTCFYGGKSSIKRRLDSILNTTERAKKPTVIFLVTVVMMTILSGSVFAFSLESNDVNISGLAASGTITSEQAKETALTTVGGGTVVYIGHEVEIDLEFYRIEIIFGDKKYSMSVGASDSRVFDYQIETLEIINTPVNTPTVLLPEPSPPSARSDAHMTVEQAEEIALAIVGGGTVIECEIDYEDGRKVFDIKIMSGNILYEMDIDAIDGSISDYSSEEIKRMSGYKEHDGRHKHGHD